MRLKVNVLLYVGLRMDDSTFYFIVCPMQCVALDRYNITWAYICLSVRKRPT